MAEADGMDDDVLRGLLRGVRSCAFDVRRHVIAPGSTEPHFDRLWRDALVLVERGELELEAEDGTLHGFPAGSVLWLTGLSVRRLHNHGGAPVVLVAVSRSAAGPDRQPRRGPALRWCCYEPSGPSPEELP